MTAKASSEADQNRAPSILDAAAAQLVVYAVYAWALKLAEVDGAELVDSLTRAWSLPLRDPLCRGFVAQR